MKAVGFHGVNFLTAWQRSKPNDASFSEDFWG